MKVLGDPIRGRVSSLVFLLMLNGHSLGAQSQIFTFQGEPFIFFKNCSVLWAEERIRSLRLEKFERLPPGLKLPESGIRK